MKKIFLKLTALLLILGGCNKYNEDNFICDCRKTEISKKEYIAMCVVPQEVTANSVNYLRMENHTKKDMIYACFRIQYFKDGTWKPIQDSTICDAMARYVHAGEALVHEVNLYSYIDRFDCPQKGRYRISRSIGKNYLYAEFEIK